VTLSELVAGRASGTHSYCGHPAAADFGDANAEYMALAEGTALLDFGWRRTLLASGSERSRFLHGQLSNDIASLKQGEGCAALLLTPQGRVVSILAVYDEGDVLRLVVDGDRVADTLARLESVLVADDVELARGQDCCRIGLVGPQAAGILTAAGFSPPPPAWSVSEGRLWNLPVTLYQRGDLARPCWDIAVGQNDGVELWERIESAGAVVTGTRAYEALRVQSGTARYGVDVDEGRIAVEARLEWAIHFDKGCYVGQEVIERIVSRGRVNRRLCLVVLEADIAPGSRLDGGKESDLLTSVVDCPGVGTLGLAYLPAGSDVCGKEVSFCSPSATVVAKVLEWPRTESA
jgi:folate-binding protein YgfZ